MNDLARVNSVTAPGDNPVSKAPIYAAIACAAIYAPLCVFMLAVGGLADFGNALQMETASSITLETL
jgi:hypothetical protein